MLIIKLFQLGEMLPAKLNSFQFLTSKIHEIREF